MVIGTGKKSREMLKHRNSDSKNEDSIVYSIQCGICDKEYIGETGRGMKTRIAEHRRDVKGHVMSNAIVIHIDKAGHLPRWDRAKILEKGNQKNVRKALEAAHIKTKETMNTRAGFYSLAGPTAQLALQRRGAID